MSYVVKSKPARLPAFVIPLLIFAACYLITFSAKFKTNPGLLSNAILIDLLVMAPLIYFIAIRKKQIARITVLRIFIAGVVVAGLILKPHSNELLDLIKTWISPLIEAGLIFFIVRKFYAANKKAKAENNGKTDFLFHCRRMMVQVVGNEKIATVISSEISVFYYAFFSRKDKSVDYKIIFTSYKENGLLTVLWVILFIFLIEATGTHFLLNIWSSTIAWVMTVLSLYTCLQLFAHMKAIKARPIVIGTHSLEIHNGLAGDALIEFDNIDKYELSKKIPQGRNSVKIALLKGLENHNMIVYLKTPVYVTKIFGIKKQADSVLFFTDRPKEFLAGLTARLESNAGSTHE